MAIGYSAVGSAQSGKTSGTSLTMTTTEQIPKGATVIVRHGFDNNAAGSLTASAPAPGTLTCSVAGAVTSATVRAQLNSGSASAAGIGINVWTFVAGTVIPAGATITVTVNASVAARAMSAAYIGATFAAVSTSRGTTGVASVSITPTNVTQAAIATIAGEDNQAQAFGQVAGWDTGTQVGTTGGNAATNVVIISARKMIVGSTAAQTYNPSGTYAGGDWVASAMLFDDTSPAVTNISPVSGLNNAPVALTVTGTNFVDVTAVTLNGSPIAHTVNSTTQITATVPAGFAAGAHSLVVMARGSFSDGDIYTVTAPTPNPPTNLTAVPDANSIVLSWTAPQTGFAPDGYRIFRANGITAVTEVGAGTTTYDDTSAVIGTNYEYAVCSVLNGVQSTLTPWVPATIVPTTPKISSFADDFSVKDTINWDFHPDTGVENGSLYVNTTNGYPTVLSRNAYDLTESQAEIRIVERPVGPTSEYWFTVEVTSANRASFVAVNDGTLVCRLTINGVETDTYPPVGSAKFLRFRETGGTLYWEKSTDGSVWTVSRSEPTPSWANSVKILFMSGYWDAAQTVTGKARYGSLNLVVPIVPGLFYVDGVAYEAVVDGVVYRAWVENNGTWVQSG